MMAAKINWGILGTGNIAKALARAIGESETGRLVAVGSRKQETANVFAEEFGIAKEKAYGTYEGMVADKDVQAVYISLPNDLHAEWAIKFADAKKAVLLEKPFTLNYPEAMVTIEAAKRNNVFLMEAFMYRCHPQSAKLAELLKAKTIGDVRLVLIQMAFNIGPKYDNIRLISQNGGGAILDLGGYALSLARLIAAADQGKDFTEPLELKAVAHIGAQSRVDEWSTATVKFPGDVLANLMIGNQVTALSPVQIFGTTGRIEITNPWFPGNTPESATISIHRDGAEVEKVFAASAKSLYANEVDVFGKQIAGTQAAPPSMTWNDSLANMRWLDRWKEQVGLKFDPEKFEGIQNSVFRTPLQYGDKKRMTFGKIPGIEKPVSRIIMGTMGHVIGGSGDIAKTCAILDHFVDSGGNALDCALVYGTQDRIGQWLKLRGNREHMVIIGKGAADTKATPEMVTEHLLQSLDLMKVDYFDAFLMHRDNVNVPVGEFVDVLNEHTKAGRIRAFGGSNWTVSRLAAANDYAAQNGLTPFGLSSPNFSLAKWNEPTWADCTNAVEPDDKAWYRKTKMPLLAWSSQANGIFINGLSSDAKNAYSNDIKRVWFNEGNVERVRRVGELARKRGIFPGHISLAYVLLQPLNIFALVGPENIEQTRSNLEALDVKLSAEEMAWLNLES